jgi:hypothetical protein
MMILIPKSDAEPEAGPLSVEVRAPDQPISYMLFVQNKYEK